MIDITLDTTNSHYYVRAYAPGRLVINEQTCTQSVAVSPTQLLHPWLPQTADELTAAHLQTLVQQYTPQILLLGVGPCWRIIDPAIIASVLTQKIGMEVMDTAAACRTFNVLAAEGRNVLAALIIH